MVTTILLALLLGIILLGYSRRWTSKLRHIPAIPSYPLIGSLPYVNPKFIHLSFTEWAQKLGPVISFRPPGEVSIMVSSYKGIRQMLLTSGKAAGGRTKLFCSGYLLQGTGILFSHKPDSDWKSLRKASHKHLKQYGEGMTNLQNVIYDVQEEMFSQFEKNIGSPVDPKQDIFDAALGNIAFLLTGVKSNRGDPILEKMRAYEHIAPKFVGGTTDPKYMMYDALPVLRFLGLRTWKDVEDVKNLQDSIFEDVEALSKQNLETHNLLKVLIAHVPTYDHSSLGIDENKELQYTTTDVKMTLVSLLLAGVTTTSTTFYAIVNILAHNKKILDKLHNEVKKIGKESPDNPITMEDRAEMPYCRAIILEALRYVTILPVGVPHRTVQDVEIDGVLIPNNTNILTDLWTLHHDEKFWKDPFVFDPERFIDADGELVAADHPNRKHLLPFGAGPRVCLGESMALARLFIWTATFGQRFTVSPAKGNEPSSTDPRKFQFEGLLRVNPYEVIFTKHLDSN